MYPSVGGSLPWHSILTQGDSSFGETRQQCPCAHPQQVQDPTLTSPQPFSQPLFQGGGSKHFHLFSPPAFFFVYLKRRARSWVFSNILYQSVSGAITWRCWLLLRQVGNWYFFGMATDKSSLSCCWVLKLISLKQYFSEWKELSEPTNCTWDMKEEVSMSVLGIQPKSVSHSSEKKKNLSGS